MKKILLVAVIVLAVTSFALSQTGRNSISKQVGSVAQMTLEWNGGLTAIKGPVPQSQCLLTYLTESISEFPVNQPAHFQLEACCGAPPYRYEIVDGALPTGLHMNQNGKINGKPTALTDTTVFIRLTDNAGCSLTQAFVVRVF
jgi:Putative Ig domain